VARLNVNIDHCATLRQVRRGRYPDPIWAATLAELAGADGITVHLREDRRHIQDNDVRRLKKSVQGVLNLEMALTAEMIEFAKDINPDVITLVPEKREELTTEGGLDVVHIASEQSVLFEDLSAYAIANDISVSLFVDPAKATIDRCIDLGIRHVELHTGDYANAPSNRQQETLNDLIEVARYARSKNIYVAAGHGLNYKNTSDLVLSREFEEFNIGHAIMAQAILVGMNEAVRDMVRIMRSTVLSTADSVYSSRGRNKRTVST